MEEDIVIIKLVRVNYGTKDILEENREYRINGEGPVGTLKEFEHTFAGYEFIIEDKISNSEKCSVCKKNNVDKEVSNNMCAKCENESYDYGGGREE